MITKARLELVAELNQPANPEAIHTLPERLGPLPKEYLSLLALANGLLALDQLGFYGVEEVEGRNSDFHVGEYWPGWVLIGDDSGGRGIFLHRTPADTSPVYLCDLGAGPSSAERVAGSLEGWFEAGLPIPD